MPPVFSNQQKKWEPDDKAPVCIFVSRSMIGSFL